MKKLVRLVMKDVLDDETSDVKQTGSGEWTQTDDVSVLLSISPYGGQLEILCRVNKCFTAARWFDSAGDGRTTGRRRGDFIQL